MAEVSKLSGDERQSRVEELKKKMQAAAAKKQAEADAAAGEAEAEAGAAETKVVAQPAAATAGASAAAPVRAADERDGVTLAEPPADGEAQVDASELDEPRTAAEPFPVKVAEEQADPPTGISAPADVSSSGVNGSSANGSSANGAVATNGSSATAAAQPARAQRPSPEKAEFEHTPGEMNRREFFTYTWGAALGLVVGGVGFASFRFLYPRFAAGTFGGVFVVNPPVADAPPKANPDGRFWLVETEDGPKALYMVCTHLGCLYAWVNENNRFECPCHGSKFTREGIYIEGPAPRSLDYFELAPAEEGEIAVDTGSRVVGDSHA